METITISVTYNVKYYFSDTHLLTECGKVIDVKKGVEVKPVLRGSQKMYFINGKYQNNFKPIKRNICPF